MVINGADYVFTVPALPGMAAVLPPSGLYTIVVTRMGGYTGPPNVIMPAPTAGTSIVFDRWQILATWP